MYVCVSNCITAMWNARTLWQLTIPLTVYLVVLFYHETHAILVASACYDSTTSTYLEPFCGTEEVIAIHDVRAYSKPMTTGCINVNTTVGSEANGCCEYNSSDCHLHYNQTLSLYNQCNGIQTCKVPITVIENPSICDPQTYYGEPSYMLMEYNCVSENIIRYPSGGFSLTDNEIHLWSDDYSSPTPAVNSVCSVEAECNSAIELTAIDIRHSFSDSASGSGRACLTAIEVEDGGSTTTLDCRDDIVTTYSLYDSSSYFIRFSINTAANFTYWIKVKAAEEGSRISVHCDSSARSQPENSSPGVCYKVGEVGGACTDTGVCTTPLSHCSSGRCICQTGYTQRNSYCHKDGSLEGYCDNGSPCTDSNTICTSGQCQCEMGYSKVGGVCYKPSFCSAVKKPQTGNCYSLFREDRINIECQDGVIAFEQVLAMAKPVSTGCPQVKISLDTPASCCQYEEGDCGTVYGGQFSNRFANCSGQAKCIDTQVPWIETPDTCGPTEYLSNTNYVIIDYSCVPASSLIRIDGDLTRSSPNHCIQAGYPWDSGNSGTSGGGGTNGGGTSGGGGTNGGGTSGGGGNTGSGTSGTTECSVEASCSTPIIITAIDVRFTYVDGVCQQVISVEDGGQTYTIPCENNPYTFYTMYTSRSNYIKFSISNSDTSGLWGYWFSIAGASSTSELILKCGNDAIGGTRTSGSVCTNACIGTSSSDQFLSADCGSDALIQVNEINAFSKLQDTGCPVEVTEGTYSSDLSARCCSYDPGDCRSPDNEFSHVYHRACMGKTSCSYPTLQTTTACSSNAFLSKTNYMTMDYTCVSKTKIVDIGVTNESPGEPGSQGYITSPGYPSDMAHDNGGGEAIVCYVQASCDTNITISLLDIRLQGEDGECKQKLYIDETYTIDCDSNNNFTKMANVYTSGSSFLRISLNNTLSTDGGQFWIAVRGQHSSSSVNVTCDTSDQESQPVGSCDQTTKTDDCETDCESSRSPPTSASTQAGSSSNAYNVTTPAPQSSDSSNTTVTLIAIVVPICLLLLLGIIALLIFLCRDRCCPSCTRKKPPSVTPEAPVEPIAPIAPIPIEASGRPPTSTVFTEKTPRPDVIPPILISGPLPKKKLPPLEKRMTLPDFLAEEEKLDKKKTYKKSKSFAIGANGHFLVGAPPVNESYLDRKEKKGKKREKRMKKFRNFAGAIGTWSNVKDRVNRSSINEGDPEEAKPDFMSTWYGGDYTNTPPPQHGIQTPGDTTFMQPVRPPMPPVGSYGKFGQEGLRKPYLGQHMSQSFHPGINRVSPTPAPFGRHPSLQNFPGLYARQPEAYQESGYRQPTVGPGIPPIPQTSFQRTPSTTSLMSPQFSFNGAETLNNPPPNTSLPTQPNTSTQATWRRAGTAARIAVQPTLARRRTVEILNVDSTDNSDREILEFESTA